MRMNHSATPAANDVIRLALPGDVLATARVLSESFAAYGPVDMAEAFAAITPGTEQIEARFREEPIWVMKRQGQAGDLLPGRRLTCEGPSVRPLGRNRRDLILNPARQGHSARSVEDFK
jgi:hypothetical protein